jgi:hypothetical protein
VVNTGLKISAVNALALSGTNLFAGTTGVSRLSNNDTTWTQAGLANNFIRCFVLSGTNLFAGTDDAGVFLSTDNGTSWTSTGFPTNSFISSLAVSGTDLFAGTYSGVFRSTVGGTIWTAVSTGLTDTSVSSLAVSGTDLFAGTNGGVWRRPMSEMVSVKLTSNPLPTKFNLDQNYPNPFNPSTTIKFELPRASQVSLTVYDVLGRQVSVLVNEKRDAGSYEVKFNGSNLASGVYFYRLQAGSYVDTKKLLLLR